MIPKIIHYIWLGGKSLPSLEKKCIKSWRKFCPDYEIKKWDETNFDINSNQYCREAYEAKKYAFASDYIRLHALVEHGGIYLDTDVELFKSLNSFLHHEAFTGIEAVGQIATAILGSSKGNALFQDFLKEYELKSFVLPNGNFNLIINNTFFLEFLQKKGFILDDSYQEVEGLAVYPKEFFSPKNFSDFKLNPSSRTTNTVSVHYGAASWARKEMRLRKLKTQLYQNYSKKNKCLFAIAHPIVALKIKLKKV